jgi:tetratricopeptide (TPR) repeat protein
MASAKVWLTLLPLVAMAGCQAPSIPDPNDPTVPGPNQTARVQAAIKAVSDSANRYVLDREISPNQAKQLVNTFEAELCRTIDISKITPSDANIYGQIFLDAQDWENARKVLTIAVAHAKNEDRRVNDTLRLAQAYAELGNVKKAIDLTKGTFDTDPEDKAPILPGVLFTIVPAGRGKGEDAQLADLLQQAIHQHELVIVNPQLDNGRMFLAAEPVLINRAWNDVIRLYMESGHQDLAEKARQAAVADAHLRAHV